MGNKQKDLISQLVSLLEGGNAHVSFEDAVKGMPFKLVGEVPAGVPYSVWQLVEHIRIAQDDIVDFSMNPKYKGKKWPDDFWPKETAPGDKDTWDSAIKQIKHDRKTFIDYISKEDIDLYEPLAHGSGQNLLREAMLIADHTSYHTGEIVMLRRLLGAWK